MSFYAVRTWVISCVFVIAAVFMFKPALATDVVVVDMNKLYLESTAGQSVRAHIEAQRAKLQTFVTNLEAPLKIEEEQLRNQKALLDPKVFRERLRQFEAKAVQLRRNVQTINDKIAELQALGRRRIAQEIGLILEQKSQQLEFKLAIDRAIPLYASPTVDLTDLVLADLNSRLTVVPLPEITVGPAQYQ